MRPHDLALLAQSPALGTRAIAPELLKVDERLAAVGPVQRQAAGPVEIDLDGCFGVGKVEGHTASVAHEPRWA